MNPFLFFTVFLSALLIFLQGPPVSIVAVNIDTTQFSKILTLSYIPALALVITHTPIPSSVPSFILSLVPSLTPLFVSSFVPSWHHACLIPPMLHNPLERPQYPYFILDALVIAPFPSSPNTSVDLDLVSPIVAVDQYPEVNTSTDWKGSACLLLASIAFLTSILVALVLGIEKLHPVRVSVPCLILFPVAEHNIFLASSQWL